MRKIEQGAIIKPVHMGEVIEWSDGACTIVCAAIPAVGSRTCEGCILDKGEGSCDCLVCYVSGKDGLVHTMSVCCTSPLEGDQVDDGLSRFCIFVDPNTMLEDL